MHDAMRFANVAALEQVCQRPLLQGDGKLTSGVESLQLPNCQVEQD